MIQTPLVGLVCVGRWLMMKDIDVTQHVPAGVCAWLSRIATFVTIIYFTALDAIGGFGLGRSILVTQELAAAGKLSQEQLSGVVTMLNALWVDPWVGGVGSFTSQTASWAVFCAALFAACALFLALRAPVGAPGDLRGHLRLATPADPCRPAWPHRVPWAYRLRCVALVL